MVCITGFLHPVMSTAYARPREVVSTCKRSQSRMQAVADLLLLTSDLRPVRTESLSVFGESLPKCRETIITRTKGLIVLSGRISEQLYSDTGKWPDICVCVQDIGELVVGLTECCAHAAYLIALTKGNTSPAVTGIIDQYKMCRANVEIELICKQLQVTQIEDLTPDVLVQTGEDIKKNLTVMTECCKSACEKADNEMDQEQFRLCIKSFTSCASCLLASIRRFKIDPTESHRRRCINFCYPLMASTSALVDFATESQFIGEPALLTADANEAKKDVLGACLSMVSACIQLCRTIRELAYDHKNPMQRDRITRCAEAVSKASSQLADVMQRHQVNDERGRRALSGNQHHTR